MSGKRLAVLTASAFLLTAGAVQAVTPAQLASPFIPDAGITVEIKDVQQLIGGSRTPLEQLFSHFLLPCLKSGTDSGISAELAKVVSCTGRLRYHPKEEKENDEGFVWAFELSEPLAAGRTAGFSLDALPPEGTTLQPFARVSDKRSGEKQDAGREDKSIYLAQMSRGEQHFLLAADNPALLSVMAGVPDSAKTGERRISGPLWLGINIPPSEISQIVNPALLPDLLASPLFIEAAVSGTERSIRLNMQISTVNNGLLQGLSSLVSGSSREHSAPLLVGGGPLLALFSFEDMLRGDGLERMRTDIDGWLRESGLSLDDLKALLKGRITLGISGTTSTLLGSFPGIYLHLSGANNRVCSALMKQFAQGASESQIKTEPFSTGRWKGFRTGGWSVLSGYAAAAEDGGLVVGIQNSSELSGTPDVPADMKDVLKGNPQLTLNVNFEKFTAELSNLIHRAGALFLNDEDKEKADAALRAMEILGVFNLTASDEGTCEAELFVREPQFSSFLDSIAAK